MKGYKMFNPGMICNGKQYAENTDFEESGANGCCEAGVMHFCETPFDCLDYYPLVNDNGEFSDFAEVEALDKVLKKDNKRATKKLHIGAKLDFRGFIMAGVEVLIENTSPKKIKTKFKKSDVDSAKIGSSGYSAQIGSSGDYAQIGSSGDYAKIGSSGNSAKIGSSGNSAKIGSSGDYAKIGSSGNSAKIGSSGDYAQIGSSGYSAQIGSSGDYAQIGSSGYSAQIGSSGDYAQIGSSGDYAKIGSSGNSAKIGSSGNSAKITASGKNSVASAIGKDSRIKAALGNWIVLAEYGEYDGNAYLVKCVRAAQVDGEKIKADTWYKLEDGEFVEVAE